jgi:hypothetical protein
VGPGTNKKLRPAMSISFDYDSIVLLSSTGPYTRAKSGSSTVRPDDILDIMN